MVIYNFAVSRGDDRYNEGEVYYMVFSKKKVFRNVYFYKDYRGYFFSKEEGNWRIKMYVMR